MKVLLVDDDEALLVAFSAILARSGLEVITAPNGQEGLNQTKAVKPDFVLLDQVLPDIQGNEVLTILKADAETKDIPVAMLSNFGQTEMVQAAINAGALDYILKYQIEPGDLANKIQELLKEHQARNSATNP